MCRSLFSISVLQHCFIFLPSFVLSFYTFHCSSDGLFLCIISFLYLTKQAIEEKEEDNENDSEGEEEGDNENGDLLVTKLGTGRLVGMTMTQACGETSILVTNVDTGGVAAKSGVKFGMVLVKVGTVTVWGWKRALGMLSNRSDTTTVTFRQCTEKNIKEVERARKVGQSERQDDREGQPMKENDNEQMKVTDEETRGENHPLGGLLVLLLPPVSS